VPVQWERGGALFLPSWWRKLTVATRLSYRLVRDGFHALAVFPSGELIAALQGPLLRCGPGKKEFHVTHVLQRGTRPLNITVAPDGARFLGEYFDQSGAGCGSRLRIQRPRSELESCLFVWKGAIRHVHNIVYDQWGNCFWVLTGDMGAECRVLRASDGLEPDRFP